MAEKIDLIVTSEALKGLDALIKKLQEADDNLQMVAEVALNTSKQVSKISSPSGFNEFIKGQQQVNAELQQQSAIVNNLSAAKIKLNQKTSEEIVNNRILAKNADDQAKSASNLVGAYQKLSLAYEKQKKLALDLGVTYGSQSKQFQDAAQKALQMQNQLKGLDSQVGINNRNVGNYANSFVEGMSKVYSKVRLVAQILPGIGIAGIFGLALDPLFNYLKGLDSIQKAFGLETEAIKASKKAIEEKAQAEAQQNKEIANTVAQETSKAQILFANAKNENNTMKQRVDSFNELKDKYGLYLKDLTLQKALAGDTAEAEYRLNDALIKRGLALSIQNLLTKNREKQIEQELQYGLAFKDNINGQDLYDTKQQGAITTSQKFRLVRKEEMSDLDTYNEKQQNSAKSQITNNDKIRLSVVNSYTEKRKALQPLKDEEKQLMKLYDVYSPYLDALKKETKERREHVELIFSSIKSEYDLKKAIEERNAADAKLIANDIVLGYETRIDAQKKLVDSTLKVIDISKRERDALLVEATAKDLDKNKTAYANKQITYQRYVTNVAEINKDYNNKKKISEQQASNDTNNILEENKNFFLKIESEKFAKYKDGLNKRKEAERQLTDSLKTYYQSISTDERFNLQIKQAAFEQLQKIELQQLDLKKIEELAAVDRSKYNTEQDSQIAAINDKYKTQEELIKKALSPMQQMTKETMKWVSSFSGDFLSKSGFSTLNKMFFELDSAGQSLFTKMSESLKGSGKEWELYFQTFSEIGQEAFNFVESYSNQNFDNEKSRLEAQKNIALGYAGDSAAAKTKIEAEYQKKQQDIQNRENKAKQKQAIFNIAIDTAQAIMSIWAHSPDPTGISQGALTAIISGIGLAEIAMVSAQKIPQYWKGGEHGGGLMMVNDGAGSNYQETIVTPDGKIMKPEGKNVIMDAPAGTQIFTHDQWNAQLKNMLQSKGIDMQRNNASSIDYNRFDEIMGRHLGNKTSQHINFDRNGFSSYISKNGNITRRSEERGSGIGIKV